MPTLIPSLPIPPTPAVSAAGEAKVLLAFHSLRDDFRIYHRKSWYSFDSPDGSREGVCEGEADFLVLHPDLGMLVLEVKGGRIAFDGRTGAWTSTARDGRVHDIKDPFKQAQRSDWAIFDKAAALSFEGQAMPEFVHGHAVVFPDCDFTSGGDGVSAPRELVIDAGDLTRDAAGAGVGRAEAGRAVRRAGGGRGAGLPDRVVGRPRGAAEGGRPGAGDARRRPRPGPLAARVAVPRGASNDGPSRSTSAS